MPLSDDSELYLICNRQGPHEESGYFPNIFKERYFLKFLPSPNDFSLGISDTDKV